MSNDVHAQRKAWKAPALKQFEARSAEGGTAAVDGIVPPPAAGS